MDINFMFSDKAVAEVISLSGDELSSFLQCNGIGYDGGYYHIKKKIFEFTNAENELTVILERDPNILF